MTSVLNVLNKYLASRLEFSECVSCHGTLSTVWPLLLEDGVVTSPQTLFVKMQHLQNSFNMQFTYAHTHAHKKAAIDKQSHIRNIKSHLHLIELDTK